MIDCTKMDPEKHIAFRKTGYFGKEEKVVFEALDKVEETENTILLLQDIFYGSTPQKEMEAGILRRILRKELSKFKEYIREYREADGFEKEDLWWLLRRELDDSSPFAAFKRWIIRDHPKYCKDLEQLVASPVRIFVEKKVLYFFT